MSRSDADDLGSNFGLDALPLSDGAAVEEWWAASSEVRGQHPFECQALERYRQSQLLGIGGMGQVSAVTDVRLNRQVALKEVGDHRGGEPELALERRLAQEAWITAQLEHPGIVPVYDAGRGAGGRLFFTMRLIRGRSLAQALNDGDLARPALLRHFLAVCQAMAYAHDVGVIHRDLKPANIMIGAFGETQVMDWGLARQRGDADEEGSNNAGQRGAVPEGEAVVTALGTRIGTPAYMSPEQARARPATEASDVWSLGAVLFEVLAGKALLAGHESAEIFARLDRGEIPRLQDVAPDVPAELLAIVDRALSTNPRDRYPEAGALARDVAAYLDGSRVEAYRYSAWDLTRRFARTFRLPLGIAAIALVALATVFGVSYSQTLDERDRARDAETQARTAEAQARQAQREAQEALDRANVAESATGQALAQARAASAQQLVLKASEAARQGFQPEAEVLVTAVLAQQDSPVARGLLARTWAQARPTVLPPKDAPSCGVSAIDHDGGRVICVGGGIAELWDIADGVSADPVWRGGLEGMLVFVDDDVGLALDRFEKRPSQIFDTHTGAILGTVEVDVPWQRHCTAPGRVLFSSDDRWLVWTSRDNGLQRIAAPPGNRCWLSSDGRFGVILGEVSKGSETQQRPWLVDVARGTSRPLGGLNDATDHKGGLSGDGSMMAWAQARGTVTVFDTNTGRLIGSFQGAGREVSELTWAPTGAWLAVTDDRGWVSVWDVERRAPVGIPRRRAWEIRWAGPKEPRPILRTFSATLDDHVMPARGGVASTMALGPLDRVAMSQDRSRLLTVKERVVTLFDDHGRQVDQHIQADGGLGVSAHFVGGKHDAISVSSGFPAVWTFRDGAGNTRDEKMKFFIRWILPADDGGAVAVGFRGGVLYRAGDGTTQAQKVPKPELMMGAVAARGGARFAFLTAYGSVSSTALVGGRLEAPKTVVDHPRISSIALSDDGKLLAAGVRDRVWVFDVASGKKLRELGPAPSSVMELAVHGAGWVAVGTGLGEVLVWDPSGELRMQASGHNDTAAGVRWSRDGETLYTASGDGTVVRWGLGHLGQTGAELAERAAQTWRMDVDGAASADLRP